eukprot:11302-Heterococcus_DN1.PRE.6
MSDSSSDEGGDAPALLQRGSSAASNANDNRNNNNNDSENSDANDDEDASADEASDSDQSDASLEEELAPLKRKRSAAGSSSSSKGKGKAKTASTKSKKKRKSSSSALIYRSLVDDEAEAKVSAQLVATSGYQLVDTCCTISTVTGCASASVLYNKHKAEDLDAYTVVQTHQCHAIVACTACYHDSESDYCSWKQLCCAALCNDLLALVCFLHTLWCTLQVVYCLCIEWKRVAIFVPNSLRYTAVTTVNSGTALQSYDTCT